MRLNDDKYWFDAMSIAYDSDHKTVPHSAHQKISLLLPHLTKSVEISRTFSVLKSRHSSALSALDRVKVGLAVARPSGEVIIENEEASRILDLHDGIEKTIDGRLKCADDDDTALLTGSIIAAASTAKGEADVPEALFALNRKSGRESFMVDIAPLRDSKVEFNAPIEGALITIIDPERVPQVKIERFVTLYNLTSAEAEVCTLLIHGGKPEEIAEMRDTSPVTVKNQIASILTKTGVKRRSELIRLVLRILPPIE